MKITKIGPKGIELIKSFEGFKAKPYLCPAGVPTIGYGSTRYADGRKVALTDAPITEPQAEDLLMKTLHQFELSVDSLCTDLLNQNQFDALCSFCYNLGAANLKSSNLLKKVNQNPSDIKIANEFMKWVYANGQIQAGLKRRRNAESNLYFDES